MEIGLIKRRTSSSAERDNGTHEITRQSQVSVSNWRLGPPAGNLSQIIACLPRFPARNVVISSYKRTSAGAADRFFSPASSMTQSWAEFVAKLEGLRKTERGWIQVDLRSRGIQSHSHQVPGAWIDPGFDKISSVMPEAIPASLTNLSLGTIESPEHSSPMMPECYP